MKKAFIILGNGFTIDFLDYYEKYDNTIEREICFLFVHGLLHLLGYDHMTKEDEEVMFKLQDEILEGENLWIKMN